MASHNNRPGKYLIGIDLGGTNIKGALLDRDGHTLQKIRISTEADKGPQEVVSRIVQVIMELIQWGQVPNGDVAGVGIGVPGQIDYQEGKVVFAPNLNCHDLPIKAMLEEKTGLPVFLDNDGNVAALGEMWSGAGMGYKNIVAVTIGTGIGGGIIIDGRLLRGVSGSAGEIGHMIIKEDGPLCNCGKSGCLETMTAAPAILREARSAIRDGKKSLLADYEHLEAKDVFIAAGSGDLVAQEIINRSAYYLGIAIANLINLLNPEVVIIGGGVARAGDILIDPIRLTAMDNCLEVAGKAARIVPAQLGNDAGCIGAGALVLNYSEVEKC